MKKKPQEMKVTWIDAEIKTEEQRAEMWRKLDAVFDIVFDGVYKMRKEKERSNPPHGN